MNDRMGLTGVVLTFVGGSLMFTTTSFLPVVLCGGVAIFGLGIVAWWVTS
jgi:hypothetical protein